MSTRVITVKRFGTYLKCVDIRVMMNGVQHQDTVQTAVQLRRIDKKINSFKDATSFNVVQVQDY